MAEHWNVTSDNSLRGYHDCFRVSGSNTLQEQLAIETENTARSLAQVLSLEAEVSGADELDPVIVQLRLSPFTDLSEFELVELRDPTGNSIFRSRKHTASHRRARLV